MKKILAQALIFITLAAVIVAGCGKKQDDPKEAFYQFQTIISDKNFASCWDMLSSKTKNKIGRELLEQAKKEVDDLPPERRKEANPVLGVTGEEILSMKPEEFFILIMERTEAGDDLAAKGASEIQSVSLKGNSATLTMKNQKETVTMIKEGKTWKIEL